jgi:sigma-B regulation protein RsbU (phosphoserine phosphatase)
MLCFISGRLLKSNHGLKYAMASLNRSGSLKSGLIIDSEIHARLPAASAHEVLIESGKFANAALPHRITTENLIAFKHLSPGVIGFCLLPRDSLPAGYPEKIKKRFFVRFLIMMLLLGFVFYCYSLTRSEWRFSIRLKLALLFLYVNGLPLLIMTSIGYEYLQQQRSNLIQENHRENEQLLLELDSGYRRYKNQLAIKTKELLAEFMKHSVEQQPSQEDLNFLKNKLGSISPSEIHIFTRSGNVFYDYKEDVNVKPQTFMRFFSNAAMIFANQKVNQRLETLIENAGSAVSIAGREVFNRDSPFLRILLNKLNKIEIFNFGTEEKLCYATLLGDKLKRDFHSFLILVWREQQAQANYVVPAVEGFNANDTSRILGTYFTFDGKIICPGLKNTNQIQTALQKAVNLQSFYDDSLSIGNDKFIATAISGKSAGFLSFIALFPLSKVEDKINFLKLQLFLFVVISLTVSTAVALSLSKQFLAPVKQLSQAVVQIGRRNFRYRTAIDTNDEFKDLGEVFNASIEELEDLEIGRVVQERLFPGNHLRHNGVEIFARTVSMTRLGGDYYDFFVIDDEHTGIFMGDVAGHGIPAAIIMAMAKASVLLNSNDRKNPALMLLKIHQMLYSLKTRKFKRMMTCQYMTLSNLKGLLTLANAGHCYPVVVADQGRSARFLELIGTPTGIMRRAKYNNSEIQLKEGDTLILYSDGMIEAASPEKGLFGADRFLKLAKESWDSDLSVYYQRMFEVNRAWAAVAEDDLTIVLIRFSGKNK